MLGEHEKRLEASDPQTFLVFFQHPRWIIKPVNRYNVPPIAFIKWTSIFHGFTDAIKDRFLTSQGDRILSDI